MGGGQSLAVGNAGVGGIGVADVPSGRVEGGALGGGGHPPSLQAKPCPTPGRLRSSALNIRPSSGRRKAWHGPLRDLGITRRHTERTTDHCPGPCLWGLGEGAFHHLPPRRISLSAMH